MAKSLDNNEIKKYLEQSKFLISDGYGPGIPIFLSKGIRVVDFFNQLFTCALLESNINYKKFNCQQLISKTDFENLYSHINDYSGEVLSFGDNMLMSDPLAQTLKEIKKNIETNGEVNLLTISSIFRNKSRGLIPLFKDRNIFPVVQLDQGINDYDFENNLTSLKKLYYNFYESIGIKILFLEAKEVPEYAEYELYFLSSLDNNFTKLGMIYKLSKKFNLNYGITSQVSLVNSGFSGKTLFMSIKNFSEAYNKNCLPPYLIASKILLVFDDLSRKDEIEDELDKTGITYVSQLHNKKSFQSWKDSEMFYFILVHKFFTLHERNGQVYEFDNLYELLKYLENNLRDSLNQSFMHSSEKLQCNLEGKTKNVCLNCWRGDYYGLILLEAPKQCERCGRDIDRAIFTENSNKRFY